MLGVVPGEEALAALQAQHRPVDVPLGCTTSSKYIQLLGLRLKKYTIFGDLVEFRESSIMET